MKLLLDTPVLLWWLNGSSKLGKRARAAIANPQSAVWVSAAVVWEIVIKDALGRLAMAEPLDVCLPRELEQLDFQRLPVSMAHALAVRSLADHHADPFDRMLVAQATADGLVLVTADPVFRAYGVETLDARR